MINLSERLQLIASLVKKDACVCDVGTDHGYLPIALMKSGKAKSVIATDLREKPLNSAKSNAERLLEERIQFRLCDGLSAVKEGEADTVIIAGMGGEVIAGIIERCEWIHNRKISLILQPMTSAEALREYLFKNGFQIESETPLEENGHVYSIFSVQYNGVISEFDPAMIYVGKVTADTPQGKAYIKKQYIRLSKCAESLEKVPSKQEEYQKYKSAAEKLGQILEGSYAV